jgi:hypothetical protein
MNHCPISRVAGSPVQRRLTHGDARRRSGFVCKHCGRVQPFPRGRPPGQQCRADTAPGGVRKAGSIIGSGNVHTAKRDVPTRVTDQSSHCVILRAIRKADPAAVQKAALFQRTANNQLLNFRSLMLKCQQSRLERFMLPIGCYPMRRTEGTDPVTPWLRSSR